MRRGPFSDLHKRSAETVSAQILLRPTQTFPRPIVTIGPRPIVTIGFRVVFRFSPRSNKKRSHSWCYSLLFFRRPGPGCWPQTPFLQFSRFAIFDFGPDPPPTYTNFFPKRAII